MQRSQAKPWATSTQFQMEVLRKNLPPCPCGTMRTVRMPERHLGPWAPGPKLLNKNCSRTSSRALRSAALSAAISHSRSPNGLRGLRECNGLPVFPEHGLVLVRDGSVHHWTVPVPFDMRMQALVRLAPANKAPLLARERPVREAIEVTPESLHNVRVQQIHESITQCSLRSEIDRQVQEIVGVAKTLVLQQVNQHGARVVIGQVPQHHCCACIL